MSRPSPEFEVLRLCSRQQFDPGHEAGVAAIVRDRPIDWDPWLRLAQAHRIAPLAIENLLRCGSVAPGIPDPIRRRFQLCTLRNRAVKEFRAAKVAELVAFLGRRSARVMLVKGIALDAIVYAKPWYTISDDADLLIDRPYRATDDGVWEAIDLLQNAATVELEYERHHDLDMKGTIDLDYARTWREARPIAFGGSEAFVMSPEDHLLAATVNLRRKRFRRLKELCAILEIVRALPIDWDRLYRNARDCDGGRIVYAGLELARVTLGLEYPADARAGLGIGRIHGSLMGSFCRFAGRNRVPRAGEGRADKLLSLPLKVATLHAYQLAREFWLKSEDGWRAGDQVRKAMLRKLAP